METDSGTIVARASEFISIISTVIGVIIGFSLNWIRDYFQNRNKRTKISINFSTKDEHNVSVSTVVNTKDPAKKADSKLVRMLVKNDGKKIATDCQVYLTSVKFEKDGELIATGFSDPRPLLWSHKSKEETQSISILPKLGYHVEIIRTINTAILDSSTDLCQLRIPGSSSALHRKVFAKIGRYIISLVVTGANFDSVEVEMVLNWKNSWDDFDIFSSLPK